MFINNFDPVAFNLFFLEIRWYSLAYIFGVLFGWIYCKKKLIKNENISKLFDDLITYLIIGIIVGGRIGYIIFYNFNYYLENPVEIFMIWNGGMSFHGGLLGVIFTTMIFARNHKISSYIFLDLIAAAAPIGIFFGRLANFINGELYGTPSNIFWSVIFPNIDNVARHPSQLYEATMEGIILFLILMTLAFNKKIKIGLCSSIFLIFYGFFRIIAEQFREPDIQIGLIFHVFSVGTLLSIVMIFFGLFIILKLKKNEKN